LNERNNNLFELEQKYDVNRTLRKIKTLLTDALNNKANTVTQEHKRNQAQL